MYLDSRILHLMKHQITIVVNDTGTFNYYETNVNKEDEDFVMTGTG